jgi:hypothetical protein
MRRRELLFVVQSWIQIYRSSRYHVAFSSRGLAISKEGTFLGVGTCWEVSGYIDTCDMWL